MRSLPNFWIMFNEIYSMLLILTVAASVGTIFLKRVQYRKHLSELNSLVAELDKQKEDFIRECKKLGVEIPDCMK